GGQLAFDTCRGQSGAPDRMDRIDHRLSRCILTVNAREGIHFGGRGSKTSVIVLPARVAISDRGQAAAWTHRCAPTFLAVQSSTMWVTQPTAAEISEIAPSRNPLRLSSPEWMRRYRLAQSA